MQTIVRFTCSHKSLIENVFFAKEGIKELPIFPYRPSKNGNRRQMQNDRFFLPLI